MLWNGECTDIIQQSKGIRQGDLISPYIFVLCLERLAHRIQKEVDEEKWKSLKASRYGPGISHLFLQIACSCLKIVRMRKVMKQCLDGFAKAPCQHVSFEKSKVFFSPNFNREEASRISNETGIPMTDDLGKYLCIQLVHQRHDKATYSRLMDKYKRKID